MTFVRSTKEFFDVQRGASTLIERADASVDLRPKLPQLFNVRKQPAADLLLVGGRCSRRRLSSRG
jgi:hypothetical protein